MSIKEQIIQMLDDFSESELKLILEEIRRIRKVAQDEDDGAFLRAHEESMVERAELYRRLADS